MSDQNHSVDRLLLNLQERAKELSCLYNIEEILRNPDTDLDMALDRLMRTIPPGWQYPDVCQVIIDLGGNTYRTSNAPETEWVIRAPVVAQESTIGSITVFYTESMPVADFGPFLKEEQKLLQTIAERLGHFIFHRNLKQKFAEWEQVRSELARPSENDWRVILDLLRSTDQQLFIRIARKMMNHLCWSGYEDATQLLQGLGADQATDESEPPDDMNRPRQKKTIENIIKISNETFQLAAKYMRSAEIVNLIQKWIQEDRSLFLVRILEDLNSSISDIGDALTKFSRLVPNPEELPHSVHSGITVTLIRRFLTDQLDYINIAKNFIKISDFNDMLQRMIFPPDSHGKLGGKSAGLFLASKILEKSLVVGKGSKEIRIPKTWHITSDVMLLFLHYNNLEDIIEQKYKPIEEIRREYPHIEQVIKNSYFPPEISRGLSAALEDLGDQPLIVRSSSLLEDRIGSIFSGKYKSLFLANQGTPAQRLEALQDAIAEVYASTFAPDPIYYRAERGLLDFHEEMGIMIQEVVGSRIGDYYFPAFAGVAFSNNEFRWSPRIKREDGLLRMVPGLGTRAVDRLGDDYPLLLAPGQPGLRVNVVPEEILRYSPRYVDVINLETNSFETMEIRDLLRCCGHDYPRINQIISLYQDGNLVRPIGLQFDPETDDMVVTFDGLIANTSFVEQVRRILQCLSENLRTPVDIEFASDGEYFYLLQCRPQSYTEGEVATPIPRDLDPERMIFTAGKNVSNGAVPDIRYIVYVDPDGYNSLASLPELQSVGQVVGMLNKLLPKRKFILIGPGRWGSRGDIKLGVRVTYADISNTAMLIEVARKKGNYVPDLSFGTHFFQDLVESAIRYLPLYPDEPENIFNERFLLDAKNLLPELLPDHAELAPVVRVIDVPAVTDGQVLRVLMDANHDEAAAFLTSPTTPKEEMLIGRVSEAAPTPQSHWRWRMHMAQELAARLDPERFGVKDIYVIGSTPNATAGPGSDIDLLIHFAGTSAQKSELKLWLEGWSQSLAQMNYLQTGSRFNDLLDVHFITDEDIRKQTSYAAKIGAVTDAAVKLPLGSRKKTTA
ncbi:MAG: nucleotidyltransferase domain-containing protein [Acidobacteria bacterium]|nr:nucleotidyltransferase domain-containing protein [Acidobacteriota bacterium]